MNLRFILNSLLIASGALALVGIAGVLRILVVGTQSAAVAIASGNERRERNVRHAPPGNVVAGQMTGLHSRRRWKYVELDGYPERSPTILTLAFQPTMDESGRTRRIVSLVSRLGAESVDEASGNALDNLINAESDDWHRKIRRQYLEYRSNAYSYFNRARTIADQYRQLHEHDLKSLQNARIAMEISLRDITGTVEERAVAQNGLAAGSSDLSPLAIVTSIPGSGLTPASYLRSFALLTVAAADVATSEPIIKALLPQVQGWTVWLVALGTTSTSLYIAYTVGAILRGAKAGNRTATSIAADSLTFWIKRRLAAFLLAIIWLALGLLVFWAQFAVQDTGTTLGHAVLKGAIALSAYVGGGIVSAIGGYLARYPSGARHAAAIRAYRRANEQEAASSYQLGVASSAAEQQMAEIEAADQVLAVAESQNAALAAQLKQVARIEIAVLSKDPAVTNIIFESDHPTYRRNVTDSPSGEIDPRTSGS